MFLHEDRDLFEDVIRAIPVSKNVRIRFHETSTK